MTATRMSCFARACRHIKARNLDNRADRGQAPVGRGSAGRVRMASLVRAFPLVLALCSTSCLLPQSINPENGQQHVAPRVVIEAIDPKLAGAVVVRNPQGPGSSYNPGDDQPQRVHRGGSFLCTDQYCTRYMLGTRGKGDVDTGSNHVGFRCVQHP